MIELKQIIETIETMEKQRVEAVKELSSLRVQVWNLQNELEEQKKESEKWKEIALKINKKA